MFDLNDINSFEDAPKKEKDKIGNPEQNHSQKELIERQYSELENLGVDLLSTIEDKNLREEILIDLINFVNDNYISITYLDQTNISRTKMIEVGELVYKFLCVDCYSTLIPNFLSSIDVYNIKQFDIYFKNNLKNDVSSFKAKFAGTISKIINKLLNLSRIDESVKKHRAYNKILKRYGFYLELVNYGNFENFLFNYFRPVLSKHQPDIVWRMM